MNILTNCVFLLPDSDPDFVVALKSCFKIISSSSDEQLVFNKSASDIYPNTFLKFEKLDIPQVRFDFENGEQYTIELKNKTGRHQSSPHRYEHITIQEYLMRMDNVEIVVLDHSGFDIPWFDGLHPEILTLREKLKSCSLYYLFPTGEYWDFILPGTKAEIAAITDPDLNIVRRPKFEIVSISKVSTPIIQFEFQVNLRYEEIVELFPEGIAVPEVRNVWVYIQNNMGIDICMVLNEASQSDWCRFFRGNRFG